MLLVRTRLGASNINGIGLFALEPIARGTPTWRYVEGFDLKLSKEFVDGMGPAGAQVIHYGYLDDEGLYVLCSDDARFFNHADEPNTVSLDGLVDVASRDIQVGEELTCDYRAFDRDWETKLRCPS